MDGPGAGVGLGLAEWIHPWLALGLKREGGADRPIGARQEDGAWDNGGPRG